MTSRFRRISLALLAVLVLTLTLTQGAFCRTLEDLTGEDWTTWTEAEKHLVVSGYVLAVFAMDQLGVLEAVLPDPMWKVLLHVTVGVIVDELDVFYSVPSQLCWPVYAAIAIRKETLNGSWEDPDNVPVEAL